MSPTILLSCEDVEHDAAAILRDAETLMRHARLDEAELSIVLCRDPFIQALNLQHRGVDRPTDVLSFAMREGEEADEDDPILGDLVISLDTAQVQADGLGHPLALELQVLLVHGFLHLLGYDHEQDEAEAEEMRGGRTSAAQGARGHRCGPHQQGGRDDGGGLGRPRCSEPEAQPCPKTISSRATSRMSASRSGRASTRSGGIFDVVAKRERIRELENQSNDPEFWTDQARSQVVLKEKGGLERVVKMFDEMVTLVEDGETLFDMGEEEQDEETQAEGELALRSMGPRIREVEIQQMLSEPMDVNDALLEINSGAGGTDASDWAAMLKRMYLGWAASRGFKVSVLDEQAHEEKGIKHVQIEVRGPYAYGYLKAEIGVHRLVRISPFDSAARRHTAFASVDCTPDLDDDIEVDVNESDCRIDTYRSSGAGGQHVNTTDSAVRITHLPTGIVAACQAERSQHKNKAKAWKMLKGRLYQHELEKRQAEIDAKNSEKKRIEWGSQIRSYVLHPYRMVKDLRTGVEMGNTDKVLAGDLDAFMESWLVQRSGSEDDNAVG